MSAEVLDIIDEVNAQACKLGFVLNALAGDCEIDTDGLYNILREIKEKLARIDNIVSPEL